MKYTQDQSFGIIPFHFHDGKTEFLLVHHQKGHWGFPKGHPEFSDKDKFETALRELKEEVGLEHVRLFKNNSFFEKYKFEEDDENIDKTVEYFLAEAKEKDVHMLEEELQNYAWLEADEALKTLTFPASKKVLKDALDWFRHNYR